jgi:hypothetical protein
MSMSDPKFSQERRRLLVGGIAVAVGIVPVAFAAPEATAAAEPMQAVANEAVMATDLGWMPDCVT